MLWRSPLLCTVHSSRQAPGLPHACAAASVTVFSCFSGSESRQLCDWWPLCGWHLSGSRQTPGTMALRAAWAPAPRWEEPAEGGQGPGHPGEQPQGLEQEHWRNVPAHSYTSIRPELNSFQLLLCGAGFLLAKTPSYVYKWTICDLQRHCN